MKILPPNSKNVFLLEGNEKAVQRNEIGAKVKAVCSRLGGAEIARTKNIRKEAYLCALRGDIIDSTAEAETTYGICGIKVW